MKYITSAVLTCKRLKQLEDESRKLKEFVAGQQLDIKMLKRLQEENW